MPFSYYARLNPRQKAIYRRSDDIHRVPLPRPLELLAGVAAIAAALAAADRAATEQACQSLGDDLCRQLGLVPARFSVLAKRPSRSWGELHGLYEFQPGTARITLWMRTAQRRQVVAFRTFFRTFLHEVGHHLDYQLLRLEDSFHTEGFYKRESSLFHQLVAAETA
jgi:hypothetical protein